ncbi:MAG: Imm27 family immunity protein [Ferruginibacter sp.]
MTQHYICNQKDIQSKLKSLNKTKTSDDGWTIFYADIETQENWILTQHESEYHGGGISILKRLPQPTIEELIDIAITSQDKNNITGASFELSEREIYNNENFRENLISKLLNFDIPNSSEFDKERLKIVIYESGLYDQTNRRDIVGKHFTEIEKDADYYQNISIKAKNILSQIKKYSS